MWGKLKLGPILRKQGFAVSDATVGRIVGELIRRGVAAKVPALIRKAAARSAPEKRPRATRKPKHVTFEKPGDVVQIDTLSVSSAQGCSIKHFDAYDPKAKWTAARPYRQATAKIAAHVEAFQHLYNHHGPQGALAGKTPAEYLSICRAAEKPQSHMS